MQVKILGSAAGGGFPQWNCACPNCARIRAGKFHGHARSQSQIAVRMADRPWCLINASPDLRTHILSDPQFRPQRAPRHSPIAAVVLTGADVDQAIGLLHLREFQPLRIYATPTVQDAVRANNSIFNALEQTKNQAEWTAIRAGESQEIESRDGTSLGLSIEALSLHGSLPSYHRMPGGASPSSNEAVVGLFIRAGAHSIFCAPSLPRIDEH